MEKTTSTGSSSGGSSRSMWVELCIVSARGLHRPSLLNWKHQWFAAAWVDPNDKYCTQIDSSGNPNPVWGTKFRALVDPADCALHVEVYSRDPLFLREKLHGSAQVSLKEFLLPTNSSSSSRDLGSFQLRKKGSNQPKGFVDVSIRTSLHKEDASLDYDYEGPGNSNVISLAREAGPVQAYPSPQGHQQLAFTQPPNPAPGNYAYTHPTPYPSNYKNPSLGGPSYPPANGPAYPPPPPPSRAGYAPTFIPRMDNASNSYLNLPPSAGAAGVRPGFAAGVGAGALAAGAVIFGDEFMSGFDLPRIPSLTASINPPF